MDHNERVRAVPDIFPMSCCVVYWRNNCSYESDVPVLLSNCIRNLSDIVLVSISLLIILRRVVSDNEP